MTPATPVGTVGFDGPKARTFAKLDLVEFGDSFRGAPGDKLLGRLRREAGELFSFVMRIPVVLSDPRSCPPGSKRPALPYLPVGSWPEDPFDAGELGQAAWSWVIGSAEKLGAVALFLQTGAGFRPTADNRKRLSSFFEGAPRPIRIAWDSQGLFSREEQAAICRDLDLLQTLDPLLDGTIPADEAYLRAVGRSRTRRGLSSDELYLLMEAMEELSFGLLALHTPNSFRDALALKRLLEDPERPSDEP